MEMSHSLPIRKLALVMAFLVCMTTTGFTMNIHFCGGKFQDVAFFSEETECTMMKEAKQKASCPMHAELTQPCCEDQDLSIDSSSHETFLIKTLQLQHELTAVPGPVESFQVPVLTAEFRLSYTTYRPPPIDRDIPVFIQSFLL